MFSSSSGFGSSYEVLFPAGSQILSNKIRSECLKHFSTLQANLGGTELYPPLQYVYNIQPVKGRTRQILLLTGMWVYWCCSSYSHCFYRWRGQQYHRMYSVSCC